MHPPELEELLAEADGESADVAWERFVDRHSRLLLHVAHSTSDSYDGAMDRYAFLLEGLRNEDYRRLRGFDPAEGVRFSTWLVVVARRLSTDHHRKRFGRFKGTNPESDARQDARARLVNFVMEELDPAVMSNGPGADQESVLRRAELHAKLQEALASLEPADRLLMTLRFRDDLSGREIADVMNLRSPFHVYRRLNNRLAALREFLEKEGITGPNP